ncbi:argS [Acrasis kona]|uniref:ArgS n=1 Tax=Acrasis kona TaxID=1008807 RepID=A0AAW2YGV5_9EUKA
MQSLGFYYTNTGKYPTQLSDLSSDQIKTPTNDSWGQPYIYIPHVDWLSILELLQDTNIDDKELQYWVKVLQVLSKQISTLPQDLDPMLILTLCSEGPLVFSIGYRNKPIFPGEDDQINQQEKIRQVAQLIKTTRERASGNIPIRQALENVSSQIKS